MFPKLIFTNTKYSLNLPNKLFLLTLSFLSCVVSVLVFISLLWQSAPATEASASLPYNESQVVVSINLARAEEGLPPLKPNPKLTEAAKLKIEDMAKNQYFSHISPVDGKKWSDFIKETNYEYLIAGENLANGFSQYGTMLEAWLNSPSHRENIMNSVVTETGVAIGYGYLDGTPTTFVVQLFGKPDIEYQDESRKAVLEAVNLAEAHLQNPEIKGDENANTADTELSIEDAIESQTRIDEAQDGNRDWPLLILNRRE